MTETIEEFVERLKESVDEDGEVIEEIRRASMTDDEVFVLLDRLMSIIRVEIFSCEDSEQKIELIDLFAKVTQAKGTYMLATGRPFIKERDFEV